MTRLVGSCFPLQGVPALLGLESAPTSATAGRSLRRAPGPQEHWACWYVVVLGSTQGASMGVLHLVRSLLTSLGILSGAGARCSGHSYWAIRSYFPRCGRGWVNEGRQQQQVMAEGMQPPDTVAFGRGHVLPSEDVPNVLFGTESPRAP